MHLYFKPGACSLAARIVLTELDIPFEATQVDTKTGLTAAGADYRSINPRGYVPALVLQDGTVITENPAILQYIADRHGNDAQQPAAGTLDRARLHEALNFISSELHKAFSPYFGERPLSQTEKEAAEAVLARRIGDVASMLADGRSFVLGETYSVADSYLFVVLNWARFIGLDLTCWPQVERYVSSMASRPAVRKAMADEGLIDKAAA